MAGCPLLVCERGDEEIEPTWPSQQDGLEDSGMTSVEASRPYSIRRFN